MFVVISFLIRNSNPTFQKYPDDFLCIITHLCCLGFSSIILLSSFSLRVNMLKDCIFLSRFLLADYSNNREPVWKTCKNTVPFSFCSNNTFVLVNFCLSPITAKRQSQIICVSLSHLFL